jgi:hypothetical protein
METHGARHTGPAAPSWVGTVTSSPAVPPRAAGGQTGTFSAVGPFDLPHPPQAAASAKKLANGVVYMPCPTDDRGILDSTRAGRCSTWSGSNWR